MKTLWIAVLALVVITMGVGVGSAAISEEQAGQAQQSGASQKPSANVGIESSQQQGAQPGTTTSQPGPTTGGQPEVTEKGQIALTMGGKMIEGTVRGVDPAQNTVTVVLAQDYGNKKKGEEMTLHLTGQTKWEGTQWKSLSDLQPGQHVAFEVKESAGKHEIQSFRAPSGPYGSEMGRGTGPSGQQTQPGQQGPSGQPQMQPGPSTQETK